MSQVRIQWGEYSYTPSTGFLGVSPVVRYEGTDYTQESFQAREEACPSNRGRLGRITPGAVDSMST